MNPMLLLQLKPAWEQFKTNHPKLMNFVKAASKDGFMDEGTLIEISNYQQFRQDHCLQCARETGGSHISHHVQKRAGGRVKAGISPPYNSDAISVITAG